MGFPKPSTQRMAAHPKNYTPGRRVAISRITFHHIVGDAAGALRMWQDPKRAGSCNYAIGSDGKIYEVVPEGDTAWCDGLWDSNIRTISIEHAGGHPNVPYSEAMYSSSAALVAYLIDKYKITDFKLHKEVSKSPTACPGGLDVARIIREAHAHVARHNSPPASAPATPPRPGTTYERLTKPAIMVFNKPANLWSLNAEKWGDFKAIQLFPRGSSFEAFGVANHTLGGRYYMRLSDFNEADRTGSPRNNVGVNFIDLDAGAEVLPPPVPAPAPPVLPPAPQPVPTPPAPPVPADDPLPDAPVHSGAPTSPRPDGAEVRGIFRLLHLLLRLLTAMMVKKK